MSYELAGQHKCPIIISKRFDNNWFICDAPTEYLVEGTLLCKDHVMQSDIQKSDPDACGSVGGEIGQADPDSHVILPGEHRCLCGAGQKG